MKLLGSFFCTLALAGCVAEPASSNELAEHGGLEQASELGFARGRLLALGSIEEGANDFELELSPLPPYESATLGSLVAVMPNHGHRAVPERIEATEHGYQILGLRLGMSGVWQLRSDLVVDEQSDLVSFEIDVP